MKLKLTAKSCSILGVLIALEIVIARFLSIHTWNLKIGFSFIPIVVAAILFGPLQAAIVAGIGDVIGAILFPVGTFIPGITLTAIFNAVIFALFLRKKQTLVRTTAAVIIGQFIGSLIFNTYWLSLLYGTPFLVLFGTRIYQAVGMSIIQIITIMLMSKALIPALRKVVK